MNPIPEPVEKALDNFFEQDVKPFVKGVGNVVKAGIDLVGKIFSPASFASSKDVDILFRSKGAKERFLTRAAAAMDGVHAQFGKMSEADQIAFVDRVKKGLKQPTPELQQAADLMRHWDDRLYRAAARFKPDLNYLENHMRVLWEVIPGSPEALQRQGISPQQIASKRPWRGSQGFLKGHTLSSMSEGIEKGGVPVTYNPVEMFMLHAQDVMKYVSANQAWEQGKESGSVQFVKKGENPPLNFTKINDSIAKAYFRTKEGLTSNTGEWYVEQGMGRMINNYLSRDYLRQGSPDHPELGKIGRGLLALKNGTTAIELGMSPFHAVFETNEAMGSSMGLGIRKLLAGQWKAGAQELGRAAFVEPLQVAQPAVKILSFGKINLKAPPGSTTKIGEAGIKFAKNEEQFRANEPEAYDWFTKNFPNAKDLITDLFDGGGQVNMNEDYRIKGLRGFQKARAADNRIGAAFRAIPTINEQALKPLFEQYIPRLKVGMFLKEHSFELAHDPDFLSGKITRGELARKNWALIEDRFGELNWDNLYWDRTLKTGLQLAFRSVTWKLGNIRAFGKAFRDVGTELYRSGSEGKMIRMTPAIGWLLGMSVVTAIQASLITKLTTGKWPADLARNSGEFWRNLIFPRIDLHDASQRVSIPTYWKDLVHFLHDPVDYVHSSMTGEIGRLWDIWNNRDFYGVQVYNPDDPKLNQAYDVMKHLVPLPFGLSSYIAAERTGATPAKAAAGFMGFTKAPYYMSYTEAEKKAFEFIRQGQKVGSRTKEQFQRGVNERIATDRIKRGELTLDKAVEEGLVQQNRKNIVRSRVKVSPLVHAMKSLEVPDAMKVYEVASPQERKELNWLMEMKIMNSKVLTLPEKRKKQAEFRALKAGTPAPQLSPAEREEEAAKAQGETQN